MKSIFALASLIMLTMAANAAAPQAQPSYTLKDNYTNQFFYCSANGSGGGGSVDPDCVKNISNWCYSNTGYNQTQCFDKATVACSGVAGGFSACVTSTAQYCYANTGYNATQCFDKALMSCKGTTSLVDLMDAVRVHSELLSKGLTHEAIKKLNLR